MSLLKTNEIQNYNGSSLTLTASTVSTSAQLNTGGNISVTGSLNVSDDSTTRTNLGLGTIATQDSDSITVTGGSVTGTEIDLKSSGTTIYKSDGSTAVLSESGGVVTLNNGTIGSGVVFPAGHIIQFAKSFTETGGGVIGNLTLVGSGSPATILTATINNVLASSKVFGFFYTGSLVLNSGQYIINNITGGSINTDYQNQSGSGNGRSSLAFFFYDDSPGTGTNSYVLTGYSNASGDAAYWCDNNGKAYGWMLFEVAQ